MNKDLRVALVRQSHSLGLEPGTDEFDKFFIERAIEPDKRLGFFADKSNEIFLAQFEQMYVEFTRLQAFVATVRRNKGLTQNQLHVYCGIHPVTLKNDSAKAIEYMVVDYDVSALIDGSDHLFSPEDGSILKPDEKYLHLRANFIGAYKSPVSGV